MPANILLAEDNPAYVFLVRAALRECRIDCRLLVATDGEQAMGFIDRSGGHPEEPPLDLLLLDLHLPKRDGEEVLAHLRAGGRYARTPVIVLSASDAPRDRMNAERHAPVHFFRKPGTLREFMELGDIVTAMMRPQVQAAPGG